MDKKNEKKANHNKVKLNKKNIKLTPIFKDKTDVAKLGKAVIALAEYYAKQEKKDRLD